MRTSAKVLAIVVAIVCLGRAEPSDAASTLAVGGGHVVLITPDGHVWVWGRNGNGQLGIGSTTDQTVPVEVPNITDAVAVAAGERHTLLLRSDGTVWAWGLNSSGQIGDGTTTQRTSPVQVSYLTNVVAVAAGQSHSVALTSTGYVWAWGANGSGQVGDGTTTTRNAPVTLSSPTDIVAIAAGYTHSLAVEDDGTVWSWGLNSTGQLGDGTTTARSSAVEMSSVSGASAVAAGQAHSLVLKGDGTVLAVGYNGQGQIGDGTNTQRTTAVAVSSLSGVTAISAGQYSSYALKSDGTGRAWGYNNPGQLGDGTTTNRNVPVQISGLSSLTHLSAGGTSAVAIDEDDVVWTWGSNDNGQLGNGTTVARSTPGAISGEDYAWNVATPVFNVAAGTYNVEKTVTITVATSGATIHYTLDGDTPTPSDPSLSSGQSVVIDESATLKAVALKSGLPDSDVASATYTLAVASIARSPGPGTYGSAQSVTLSTTSPGVTIRYTTDGNTPTESSSAYSTPISIGTTTTLKAVGFRTGWTSSAVMTATYTMNFGTLDPPVFDPAGGNYTSEATVSLSAASGATIRYTTNGVNVTDTSPVYAGPLAVSTTSTVKARAYRVDYTTSTQSSETYTIAVATPQLSHTSGTYNAGQVVAITTATAGATLRYTLNGQTPTTSDPIVPAGGIVAGNFTLKVGAWKTGCTPSSIVTATYEVIGTLTSPKVAAGSNHSVAVREDGLLWGWGNNGSGMIGDGTTTSRTLPVMVVGATGAIAVTAGQSHSVALLDNGTLLGWGVGGLVGDGTSTQRTQPTPVASLTGVVAVEAGLTSSFALKSDGTVWAWGTNSSGQLGDGSTTARTSPVQTSGLSNITGVSGGWQAHSLAVESDGTVWSWGGNGNGQLGTGNTTSRSTPGEVNNITTATAVSAGSWHSLVLLANGTVVAFGSNGFGQLGDGTTTQRTSPVAVSSLSDITAISAGGTHSLALDDEGTVWAWGLNGGGQLGDGTTTQRTSPVEIQGLPTIVFISAGDDYSLAVAEDGSVWAWGWNSQGELGDGTTTNRSTPVPIANEDMAWKVVAPTISAASGLYTAAFDVTVTSGDAAATLHYTTNGADPTPSDATVTSGATVAVGVSLTLKVRAWKPGAVASEITSRTYELKVLAPTFSPDTGSYGSAQNVAMSSATPSANLTYTADGTEPTSGSTAYSSAVAVSDSRTLKARAFKTGWTASDSAAASYWIYPGSAATPTISPAGDSYEDAPLVTLASTTSGATIRFTLDGSTPTVLSSAYQYPFLVARTTTVKAKAFLAGLTASSTATETFTLEESGRTETPAMVPAGGRFATEQTVSITGPSGATLRYTTDGTDPTDTDDTVPGGGTITVDRTQIVKVRAWLSGSTPSVVQRADFMVTGMVAGGVHHSLGLAADGEVFAWGNNGYGAIGDGTFGQDRESPVSVLTGAAAIAAGEGHSLALMADGTVKAWGRGTSGELGTASGVELSPVAVDTLTGIIVIAAGYRHSLALKDDGTVWAWGNNSQGQLGDGTTTNRTSPVQVLGLSGVTSIAAGDDFSLAVQADGATGGLVWAWGKNATGQLGDGSTATRDVPVRVLNITDAVQVAAGRAFGLARRADGTVRAWGTNTQHQLGNLWMSDATSAVDVPVLKNVTSIAAGDYHALAIDRDGRLWGWGRNGAGELGAVPSAFPGGIGAPREIPNIRGVAAVEGGGGHTIIVHLDGTVWASGNGIATGLGTGQHRDVEAIDAFSLAPNEWLTEDDDEDGLLTWEELLAGTDPLLVDSNGNGLSDLVDVRRGSQSANPDDDGDGVPNAVEIARGTDPFRVDTDGDSVSDLLDAFPLDPTRDEAPAPNPSDTTPPVIILTLPEDADPL